MSNPFQTGDKVYILDYALPLTVIMPSQDFVLFRLDDGSDLLVHYRKVSYSPWPAPDHQRK